MACQPANKNSRMTQDQLASLICTCAQPIVSYNEELRTLAAADDMGGLSQKMIQGDQIMELAISCIIDQVDDTKDSLIDAKLEQLINDQCHLDKRMIADLVQKVGEYEIPSY